MQRERWGSRIGVILAVAGSAVGLGNFLRFPGQAAQNGGGAFMLPYFISLLVLGIPLCWAEWTMGRYGGTCGFNSAPGIYSVIWRNRCAKYFGAIALLLPLVIYMYYVLIEAWCLGYALQYISGDLILGPEATAADYGSFFANFSGQDADGALLSEGRRHWLFVLAGVFASDNGPEFLGLNGTDYYIAAYLAVPMAAVALIGLPVALAGYRERGVLRRLSASGLSALTVIGAQVLVTALLVVIGAGLVLAVAAPVYGLPEMHNLAGVVGAFALGAAMLLVLGVVLGLLVSTARSAQALGLLLFMPMWLLGGGGPPSGVMTGPMQTIADFLPLTPVTNAVRESWLRGGDIGEPLLQAAAWLVVGVVLVAVLLWRRGRE